MRQRWLANKGSALQSTLGHAADARMAVFVNVYVCVSVREHMTLEIKPLFVMGTATSG